MRNHFDILDTPIAGLHVLHHKPIGDSRGYLERLFCAEELQAIISGKSIIQINHTFTAIRGTVRGMHFQYPPYAEIKFVNCLHGEVFDVAVDLRRNSSTFLCWHAEQLSPDSHKTLLIPEGIAHGFQTLSNACDMLYLHTAAYQPTNEGGLNPLDQRLAITWPLAISEISARDAAHPLIDTEFKGVSL